MINKNNPKKSHSAVDVKNHCGDVNTCKPFGLRSDYVQITFNCVQIAFDLCKNYVNITQKMMVSLAFFFGSPEAVENGGFPLRFSQFDVFLWNTMEAWPDLTYADPWQRQKVMRMGCWYTHKFQSGCETVMVLAMQLPWKYVYLLTHLAKGVFSWPNL